MVTTKNVPLIDLSLERIDLLAAIESKRLGGLIQTTNEHFHPSLYRITPEIEILLATIEQKIRKAEIIYYTFIEDIDPQIINGSLSGIPFELTATFTLGTTVFKNEFSINDPVFYKETVDVNFQTFVLSVASAYENIVRLIELLIKKVIIHNVGKPPLTAPLHSYLEFIDSLILLSYRSIDPFTNCLIRYRPYFDEYLITINELRNSYIHGFKTNTAIVSGDYKITKFQVSKFNQSSPKLNVEIFSLEVLTQTSQFARDLLVTLTTEITSNITGIPI